MLEREWQTGFEVKSRGAGQDILRCNKHRSLSLRRSNQEMRNAKCEKRNKSFQADRFSSFRVFEISSFRVLGRNCELYLLRFSRKRGPRPVDSAISYTHTYTHTHSNIDFEPFSRILSRLISRSKAGTVLCATNGRKRVQRRRLFLQKFDGTRCLAFELASRISSRRVCNNISISGLFLGREQR